MPQIILKINTSNDKIYDSENICCYLADASLPENSLQKLKNSGKLLLLFGDKAAEKLKPLDADGIVVWTDSKKPIKAQIRPLREKIGAKKALGVVIAATRHEAMLASEVEPEFVAFRLEQENKGPAADVIKWYNELFLIQSAIDLSSGLQDIKGLDVDFVIINSSDYDDFSC